MLIDRLNKLLEPLVESLGYELVLVEFVQGGSTAVLRLFIDQPEGIRVEDCQRVSREVAGILDVEDPITQTYNLEVSSPGLDRPLAKPEHFERFAGDRVKLTIFEPRMGQRRFTGMLEGVVEGRVQIRTDTGSEAFEFSEIEQARVIPDFQPKRVNS